MQEALTKAGLYLEAGSKSKEGFDLVLINEDLEATFKSLEGHIYGVNEESKLINGKPDSEAAEEVDATMADAPAGGTQEPQESQEVKEGEIVESSTEAKEASEVKEAEEMS